MLKYISGLALMLVSNLAISQNNFNAQIIDEENKELLIGASVYLPSIKKGAVTDTDGEVMIDNIPDGIHEIRISFIGYESQRIKYSFPLPDSLSKVIILLHPSHEELKEVFITATRSSRTIDDIPSRIEVVAGEELEEKGIMKPGDIRMLLSESTGIQTQQTSATSYNSSIRIQGLDGKYTQLLRDGLPLYSGFSGGLSLMQIAPLDLKQVEVIKGASSTLYGAGAIAGLVNLVSKTPEDEQELSFMLNGTSALGLDVSGFYAEKYGKTGTTVFASYNKGTPYDPADIGLTAIPKFDRFTLNPRLFLYINEKTDINLGFNFVTENRLGGNVDYIKGKSVSNPYFEKNKTDRLSGQLQLQYQLDKNTAIEVKNSVSYFDRSIFIPDFSFEGRQISSFSEVNFSKTSQKTEWITGINLWTEGFNQTPSPHDQDLGYSNTTVGFFGQNTSSLADRWTLETGIRADYQSDYGFFPLPRFSLMVEPSEAITLRLGGGLGYKTPTVFSEESERRQFQYVSPIRPESLKAERSYGMNFDINYRIAITDELTLSSNTLLFYTQIQNPLMLVGTNNMFEYQQSEGITDTKGVEINMKWSYDDFKLFSGYTFSDVNQHIGNETMAFPLVAKHRLNNVLMYEKHDDFRVGLEAYYFSPQLLGDGAIGQSYWIFGLMIEKKAGEHLSLFLNFENFTDTRQTAFDTIFSGTISDPQFRDIYAPVDGFVYNGGIKLKW